jgi:hypothetical protein
LAKAGGAQCASDPIIFDRLISSKSALDEVGGGLTRRKRTCAKTFFYSEYLCTSGC